MAAGMPAQSVSAVLSQVSAAVLAPAKAQLRAPAPAAVPEAADEGEEEEEEAAAAAAAATSVAKQRVRPTMVATSIAALEETPLPSGTSERSSTLSPPLPPPPPKKRTPLSRASTSKQPATYAAHDVVGSRAKRARARPA